MNRFLCIALLCMGIVLITTSAQAADSYQVNNGATVTIDEHGVCQQVTNNVGAHIFVPTRTATEWSTFRSNKPGSVSLATCTAPCSSINYICGGGSVSSGNLSHGQTVKRFRGCGNSCPTTLRHVYNIDFTCNNGNISANVISCSTCQTSESRSCRSCFAADSQVLMADGTSKDIEDVLIGEYLMGGDGKPTRVVAYDRPMMEAADWDHQRLISINGSDHFITNNHPVLTTEGWKALLPKDAEPEAIDLLEGKVTLLEIGDEIILHGNKTEKVESIDILQHKEDIRLYNFVLADDPVFFVNGMAVMSFVPDKAGKFEIHLEHRGETKE